MSDAVLRLEGVTRTFRTGDGLLEVLRGVDLAIASGEIVALVAPSGAGKSTLLHIAGLLEHADAGRIVVDGREASSLGDSERTALRRATIGFVYQFHHLLPEFSVAENMQMPLRISGEKVGDAERERVREILSMLGLTGLEDKNANQLSGGQKQRVAVGRALMKGPAIVLADEPTGNLDTSNTEAVYRLFREINEEQGTGFLIVTHDREVAEMTDRILEVRDGELVQDVRNGHI